MQKGKEEDLEFSEVENVLVLGFVVEVLLLVGDHLPRFGEDVRTGVIVYEERRTDDVFVVSIAQPSGPPAEGAVGDDDVVKLAHQSHILPRVLLFVPVYESGVAVAQDAARLGNVIREDIEMRIGDA